MRSLLVAVPCALMLSTANAATPQVAVGGSLGLMGIGADLFVKFNDKVNGRLSGRFGSIDADGEEDGIDYNGSLDLSTTGALIDFHPWGGSFRITGGVYSNSNELDLEATSPNNAEIGDVTYNITDGKVNSNVSFDSTAPYLGIGWGNPMKAGSRWTFMTDIGVLFQGSPSADISATGDVELNRNGQTLGFEIGDGSALDQEFQGELKKEQDNLNDDLEDFDMMPVVSVGLSYRF